MKPDTGSVQKILVLMPDKHLGNLLVSLSAICSLRDCFNDKTLFLVVDDSYREILEAVEGFNIIQFYPRRQLMDCPPIKRLWMFFRFVLGIRKLSAEMVIDLEGRQTSSLITLLAGAPLRVGRSTAKLANVYNRRVMLSTGKHKTYNYTDIIEAVGCPRPDVNFRLTATDDKRKSLAEILHREGIDPEQPIVCMHPGAGKIYKQWSTEGFAEIIDWLSSKGFQVVLVGSSIDSGKIEDIEALTSTKPLRLDGKLTLGELMALFEQGNIFIGNDSGPMHLAALTGIPVVALFSTADENRWKPLSDKCVILRTEIPCDECTGKKCEYNFKCMNSISPEDVKVAVERLINGP